MSVKVGEMWKYNDGREFIVFIIIDIKIPKMITTILKSNTPQYKIGTNSSLNWNGELRNPNWTKITSTLAKEYYGIN